jgi:hypothetical protein
VTDPNLPPDLEISDAPPSGLRVTVDQPYRILVDADFAGSTDAGLAGPLADRIVQVTADTTRDITLAPPALFNISGTVSGIANIPNSQTPPSIVFTAGDGSAQGTFTIGSTGGYQGKLPAGNYVASIEYDRIGTALQGQSLALYNVGSVSVSSASNFLSPLFHSVMLPLSHPCLHAYSL